MNPYTVTSFTTDHGSSIPGELGAPPTGLLRTPWHGLYIKPDHQPLEQWSASQLETAACTYLWGLRYLIGLRKPEKRIETREDEAAALVKLQHCTKRERSLLFGTLLHKRLERYFRGEAVDWTDDVGQRALAGLGYLPQPNAALRIEAPIALQPNTVIGGMDLAFVGFVDLEDPEDPEILYDYKTTGNFRWMKRPDELRENVPACLYALSSMQRKGTREQRCRWVYFASVGKPEARPVEFTITYDQAITVVRSAFVQAAGLRQHVEDFKQDIYERPTKDPVRLLPLIEHLPKNTGVCNAYGGCPYHSIAGGPCNPGLPMIDLSNVTETKTQGDTDMTTLADRLSQLSVQAVQTTPVQQPQANPFAAAPVPAQMNPAAFGGPQVSQDVLTGPAPVVAPFNPGANPFAAAPVQQQPQAPQNNPFAAPAPAAQPQAPQAPQFAASSLPAAPMYPQTANPFGPPPVQQPVQHVQTSVLGPTPDFPGVNSPEASTAISADAAAAQPQGKRKRRTQAEMQAARSGTPAASTPAFNAAMSGVADQQDGYNVTITITDSASGAIITIPAPENITLMMVGALGSVFEGLR